MKNIFKVCDINVLGKKITYDYEVRGTWKKYFNLENKLVVRYNVDIEGVPDSVAVIPLLCMVLPIAWLCDAEIEVNEVDSDFFNNIEHIKRGYIEMYPMLKFRGKIVGNPILNIATKCKSESAAFFSGGVDAFYTLICHLEEKPVLFTVWGADVRLDDLSGWERVRSHVESIGKEFGLENIFVKSNFKASIFENRLNDLVKDSGDGWWHGFYCGIGIIGLASAGAYTYGIKNLYIASSFPESMKGQYTCGSDPTIDNYVKFCGCQTIHDGYENARQRKIYHLSKFIKNENKYLKIRVCWSSSGGGNCCQCEKCYRTIMGFVSEGIDPNQIGFNWDIEKKKHFQKKMEESIMLKESDWQNRWEPIKNRLVENGDGLEEYRWLVNMSYDEFMNAPIKKIRQSIGFRIIRTFIRRLRNR